MSKPEGLQALLRLKTRFDTRTLEPLLTEAAGKLLTDNPDLALQMIAAFSLTHLETAVANLPPSPGMLLALKELGSKRSDLFIPLTKSPDPKLRDAALAALTSTPDKLFPLWPGLNAAQRRAALESLAASPASAAMLVGAVLEGKISRDELNGPLVERLQAVLKGDAALGTLLDSMSGLFASVLELNGTEQAWVDSKIVLEGPFTVEAWVKLASDIGNQDSLLGAPGQLDLNFYDSRLRVWVGGGLHDVAVASKPITPMVWTHVAVTRTAAGKWRIYQNGEPNGKGTQDDGRTYQNLAIGRSNAPLGTNGQFTEYRVWNICRSPEQIMAGFDRTGLKPRADPPAVVNTAPATSDLVYYQPLGVAWEANSKGAREVRTMDFPSLVTPGAAKALDEKFAHYRALAEKLGDPDKGRILGAVCTACHLVGNAGGQIGPNLSSAGAMGTESLLRNILTPNAAMEPGYRVFRVEITDGSLREGFLAAEEETAIVMRIPGTGDQRIPRDQIRHSSFTKRSLMPEGLEQTYTPEQWTDLFAWLKSLR